MTNDTATAPVPMQRRLLRRRLLMLAVMLLLPTLPLLAYLAFCRYADQELQRAVARLDRDEPGWRLEDLEAALEVIPDEENSALKVIEAYEALPQKELGYVEANRQRRDYSDWLSTLCTRSPVVQLDVDDTLRIRDIVYEKRKGLTLARGLGRCSRGRFPREVDAEAELDVEDYLHSAATGRANAIVELLYLDALLRAQDEDTAGALESCKAAFQASRAIGDDLSMYAQFWRIQCRTIALNTLERILAQGKLSPAGLGSFQRLLEREVAEEANRPLLVQALRGLRALMHRYLMAVENQQIHAFQAPIRPAIASIFDSALPELVKLPHSWLLDHHTRLIALQQQPYLEQVEELKDLDDFNTFGASRFTQLRLRVEELQDFHRSQAQTRCAAVALAVERFRLVHQRWPESLAELPPFPRQMGIDPFDGAPLRYRKTGDGVVIYSIDADGTDDGGTITKNAYPLPPYLPKTSGDVVFRLWDVDRRRQPPPPPAPPVDERP